MYLLIISPYLPSEHSGHAGAQLIFRNVKELAKDHKITIAAFTNKEDKNYIIDLEKNGIDIIDIPYERNPGSILGKMVSFFINWLPMFRSFFGLEIFFISKYNRKSMHKKLEELKFRKIPDLVQFEYNVMHHYADIFPNIPKVLIQHDISTKVYERSVLENINSKSSKDYRIAQENENHWMNKFDAVVVLTEEDKLYCEKRWEKLPPIFVIPPQVPLVSQNRSPIENKICFIGSFNREPNNQAVDLLLEDIFPKLKHDIPGINLVIAGKFLSPGRVEKVKHLEGVIYSGYVQDIDKLLCAATLMIAPILIGAGLKMKITHALACGTPVLTTPVGAEGIPLNSDEGLYIENYDGNFIKRAVELLLNQEELKSSGLKGQKQVQRIFSPEAIGEKFDNLYHHLQQS
jgi:glycosyltransferase involved in cell wall biosynthesis